MDQMKRICLLLTLLISPLFSEETEEESLFLRRIADFWQEGELQLAKIQIEDFLAQFPQSSYSDILCVALGDLNLREKNYSQAIEFYSQVASPEYATRVFLNRMQCLYQMQWYATLADECETFLQNADLEEASKLHGTYFLAIALYQQCLNAQKDPETLQKLAMRAKPYFEMLFASDLSVEVAQAFAHLCCILKDFEKASNIYLDIAQKDPSLREEMTFQAALIQAEFDKKLAIQTFNEIANLGQKRAKEATYNKLILSYDLGLHEELVKEDLIQQVPEEKEAIAHLFLGRSLLALKKYPEAAAQLKGYIEQSPFNDSYRAALISLLDASFHANDLLALDLAIRKLEEYLPQDPEQPKALLSRAQLLKKNQTIPEARTQLTQLLDRFPNFSQRPQALFELTHLDYHAKAWDSCRSSAHSFLTQFADHDLAPFAWRYLISASTEIAAQKPELKKQLIEDLEWFLGEKTNLSSEETTDFEFLLATTYFERKEYEKTFEILQSLLLSPFGHEANATLLLALCYRDGKSDLKNFCQLAEIALKKKANLVDPAQLHTSLFNSYLEQARSEPEVLEKAADHLFSAFEVRAEIQTENLLWLADSYYDRIKDEIENDLTPSLVTVQRTASILEKLIDPAHLSIYEENLYLESEICKLAKLYSVLGRFEDETALLEKLISQYHALPELKWGCEKEARLLLAQSYLRTGKEEQALPLFDFIVSTSATIRNKAAAAASLYSARLKFAKQINDHLGPTHPAFVKVLTQLKDLILQRSLNHEPIHLEAAFDYIDYQSKLDNSEEKKLKLLIKTKSDFEQSNDLLSKDYHEARAKLPRKNQIYEGYMRLIDAEILLSQSKLTQEPDLQKELQAKAKGLLLQIIESGVHPALVGRARQQLGIVKSVDETKT